MQRISGSPRCRWEGTGQGGKYRIEVFRDEFGGAGAGRNNGPARAVLFVDLRKEIEVQSCGTIIFDAVWGDR